jgi:type I restriction enzyme S subunit
MASVKDLTSYGITLKTCRHISEEDFQKLIKQGCKPQVGDVLISKDGATALDTVCEIKAPIDAVLLSSVAILRPNPKKVLPSFLRLYLDCDPIRQYMKNSFTSGAAIPRVVLKDFKRVEINLPPLETQRKIASIFSAYDDLIENNTRRIKILEEMAKAIYREWFVNFHFPGHEKVRMVDSSLGRVPEGWGVGRLDDALLLQRGFDLPKKDRVGEGSVPVFAATGLNGHHNEAKVKAPCVITGRSGSLGTVIYVDEDFWPLNTTLWVKEFRRATPIFSYYLLSGLGLAQYNAGAAVPTLNRNDIHCLSVVLPPRHLLEIFESRLSAIFRFKKVLQKKAENLRQTRDLLLPKLISGEVEVSELAV